MADYYPVLARAIAGLEQNTAENRRSVYERARGAIVRQLRAYDPPLSESEITRERLALEDAVRRIESEVRERARAETGEAQGLDSGQGFVKLHSAAADAAALGAATATAQASASAAQDAIEPERPAPRIEPKLDKPKPGQPKPDPREPASAPYAPPPAALDAGEPVPDYVETRPQMPLAEEERGERGRSRGPAIAAIMVVLVLIGLGAGAYFARDEIGSVLGETEQVAETAQDDGDSPKIADRVGAPRSEDRVPSGTPETPVAPAQTEAPADQVATAPQTPPPSSEAPASTVAPVAQRAILYEEAPDRQGGSAYNGQVEWRTEPVSGTPGETQLRADIRVPERSLQLSLVFRRNLDQTLPASHTIDIQFTLPADFPNAGIANVPGILFKPTEDAGGTALAGLSVRVMSNFFLIGLSSAPADQTSNLQAIREQPWIDLPILYENGRRAVLTIEKGTPGEQAFKAAFEAWDRAAPVAQSPAQ